MEQLNRDVMEIRVVTDNRVPALRELAAAGAASAGAMGFGKTTALGRFAKLGTSLRHAVPVFKTRTNAPVFRLVTSHGYSVTATDNHKFFSPGGLVELKDLAVGDEILLQSAEGAWSTDYSLPSFTPEDKLAARVARGEAHLPTQWSRELGQLLGWQVADGWTSEETPAGRNVPNYSVGFLFGGDEVSVGPGFRALIKHWTGLDGNVAVRPGRVQLIYKSALYYFLRTLGIAAPGEPKRVPDALWRAPREAVIGFLQGMFTADGTVNISARTKTCSVRLAASNKALLADVQLLLLNLGIVSKLRLRRAAGTKLMPDGRGGSKEYAFQTQFELILDKENRDRFVRTVGFLSPAKQQKAERWMAARQKRAGREQFVTRIESIEPAGSEDVYCTTEPATHSIVVNGCVTAQCGEQPLLAYDVCNLGSINVGIHVKDGKMDWNALRLLLGLDVHELHQLAAERYAFFRVISNSQTNQRIGKAHHAESDPADPLAQVVDLRQRVLVDVDDVVEEVRGQMDVTSQRVPIHLAVLHVNPDVDRRQDGLERAAT